MSKTKIQNNFGPDGIEATIWAQRVFNSFVRQVDGDVYLTKGSTLKPFAPKDNEPSALQTIPLSVKKERKRIPITRKEQVKPFWK